MIITNFASRQQCALFKPSRSAICTPRAASLSGKNLNATDVLKRRASRLPGHSPSRSRTLSVTAAAAAAASESTAAVTVRFTLSRRVDFGKCHRLVGDHPTLGNWKDSKAVGMSWSDGDNWSAEISVPPGTTLEFKIIEVSDSGDGSEHLYWEPRDNHVVVIPEQGATLMEVNVRWGSKVETRVNPSSSFSSQNGIEGWIEGQEKVQQAENFTNLSSSSVSSLSSFDEVTMSSDWAGGDTVFMQSNEHSGKERRGVWKTDGLQGAALQFVQGDSTAPSWLNKLDVAKRLLVDEAPAWRPEFDALSHAFVYLSWVATGAVQCIDAGGHRRPNHHADLGKIMFRTLEWIVGERPGVADSILARKLHTRLPSFADEFTQSVPLTRIRDIAHRNDIPQWLKGEIKHTIQNKLHRNAGPEDLVATERLLAKVSETPGQYPEAFMHEMRTFVVELREFFNAGGLSDSLRGISSTLDDASVKAVDRFLANKESLERAGTGADDNAVMDALHGTATVRALLAAGLNSGLRNDAPDRALSMRQRWRLAEIRAEDYAFVLLSRFINSLEQRGGAAALAAGSDGTWGLPIGALVIAIRHVGLCGFQPAECMAIERELATWQHLGGLTHKEEALRLRATLQRAQRLADAYCQLLLDSLAAPARTLGAALGVDAERSSVFAESEIRANVVFQLSKLAMLLQRATTEVAQMSPWDVIVGGKVTGVLLEVAALEPGCLEAAAGGDAILLVKAATGDEEVASLGANLKGVILRHSLPHLSHLGVRARQEKVPFVACEDEEEVGRSLQQLLGKKVTMTSEVDGVTFALATEEEIKQGASADGASKNVENGNGAASAAAAALKNMQKVSKVAFIPLNTATPETCGSKGAACGALVALAEECAAAVETRGRGDGAPLFEAPDGVVLPFGCLEAAVAADGKAKIFSETLSKAELAAVSASTSSTAATQLETLAGELATIISTVRLPQTILLTLGGAFDPGSTVIARSSANVEDLAGLSGAGLYDSIPNINPRDPAALQTAITGVWASLYTRRALLARAAAGLVDTTADMAVVVQRQLAPELSFVLHTAHPLTRDEGTLVAEVAPGMGEILASGTRGSAWRLAVEKATGKVETLAFANFSQALLPTRKFPSFSSSEQETDNSSSTSNSTTSSTSTTSTTDVGASEATTTPPPPSTSSTAAGGGGLSLATAAALSAATDVSAGTVAPCVVDYSQLEMSWSDEARVTLGQRLSAVGRLLEVEFGGAQDVEGCVVDGRMYVVQTRPQP